MRNSISVGVAAFLTLFLSACFTTDLTAPRGKNVRILSQNEKAEFRYQYKDFYLLYGILPIWWTTTEEIIEREGLSEIRVQTEDTVSDSIISIITGFVVFPQTIVVEGNYAPGRGRVEN